MSHLVALQLPGGEVCITRTRGEPWMLDTLRMWSLEGEVMAAPDKWLRVVDAEQEYAIRAGDMGWDDLPQYHHTDLERAAFPNVSNFYAFAILAANQGRPDTIIVDAGQIPMLEYLRDRE